MAGRPRSGLMLVRRVIAIAPPAAIPACRRTTSARRRLSSPRCSSMTRRTPASSRSLEPDDFFREQNRWTYEACLSVADRSEEITLTTAAHELDRAGHLDAVGGEPFLVEMAGKYFTAVGVEAHARIVARDALYRRLIEAAGADRAPRVPGRPRRRRACSPPPRACCSASARAESAGDFKQPARPARPVPRGSAASRPRAARRRRALAASWTSTRCSAASSAATW